MKFFVLVACVNCIRWSNNGRYLASASDDKLIMIWQFSRFDSLLICWKLYLFSYETAID